MNILGLLGEVTGEELSVIKDPFNKNCVTGISLMYSTRFNEPTWRGDVEFRNGNTSGEQKIPECKTFEEAVAHIKQILDSINK